MKSNIITITLIAVFLIAGVASAQPYGPPGGGRGPRAEHPGMPGGNSGGDQDMSWHGMCQGMNLTDDQEKQLDKLKIEQQKEMLVIHSEMQGLRVNMKQLIVADKFDKKAVSQNASKISAAAGKIAELKANHMRKVRDLLTEDQRLKFDQKILSGRGGPGKMGMPHKGGPGHGRGR